MYKPKYDITNRILKNVGQIEASREVVDNAPIVPHYEKSFETDAVIKTVHHGTHIEGNDLSLMQTKKVLEGEEVVGKPRDVQEVINYRNVVRLMEDLKEKEDYSLDELLIIHSTTVNNIVDPDKAGKLRNTQVIIKEEGTGKVIFQPPPAFEVPYLVEDFLAWMNSEDGRNVHPVLRAGIAHYILVTIHPFVEGNGRAVRAFANMVLLREGYDIKRFFALEEHFDKDLRAYYDAFFQVDKQSDDIAQRDLTPWLEYFTEAVAVEMVKIKEKVRKISVDNRIKSKMGTQVALSERQMRLVEYLTENRSAAMKDLKDVLKMVSEDTILRDIKDLLEKGVVMKEGKTKAAKYIIASKA